jgi:uncharacterized protein (TIGR02284 family)
MANEQDLNLNPNGISQGSSSTPRAYASALDSPGLVVTDERDPEDRNGDAIDTLNNLLECCRNGEFGFRECAEHATAPDIKTVLNQRSDDCQSAGAELYELILQMGGKPDDGGTVSEALHRGWVAIKGTLSGYSDYDMLDECERAEDVALAQYRKALKQSLPMHAQTIVERQAQGAQKNHDQIKALRDAYGANR